MRVERAAIRSPEKLRWSAIFSGAFLTVGFAIFFLLLGNAIGLNVANAVSPAVGGALKFWSWIYVAATLVLSYFLGGYLSTRSADIVGMGSGALHGMTSWGLATAIFVIVGSLVGLGFRTMLSGLGTDSGNWLSVCIAGLGCLFATLGGGLGKTIQAHEMGVPTKEGEARRVG